MSPGEIWSRLGLEPTTDRSAIRRAYSARLKQVNPEEDPDGFMALRAAYEAALADASAHAVVVVEAVEVEPPEDHSMDLQADSPPSHPPILSKLSERAPHDQLILDLERLLQDGGEPQAQLAMLEALLTLPSMELLRVQIRVESALADLIASHQPVSDPLVARAVDAFAWTTEGEAVDAEISAPATVAARLRDLQHLTRLKAGSDPDRRTVAMLARLPNARSAWTLALRPGRAQRLRRLIRDLQDNHPGLALNFPPGAFGAWSERLAQPQPPTVGIWIVLVGALLAGGASLSSKDQTGLTALSATLKLWLELTVGGLSVLLAYWLGVQWPRWLWLNRWSARATPWARHGWGLLAAIVFALGFSLPAAPWALVLTGVGAAAVALWSWITGRRFAASPSLYPPAARWPGRNAGLALLLWLLMAYGVGEGRAQVALAVVGPAVATGFAEADLARFWMQTLDSQARKAALAVMTGAAVAVTLWAARDVNHQTPLTLLAAIALLAFAQRLPAAVAPPKRREANLNAHPRLVILGGIFAFLVVSSMNRTSIGFVALILPTGALLGLLAAWNREPAPRLWLFRRPKAG